MNDRRVKGDPLKGKGVGLLELSPGRANWAAPSQGLILFERF